MSNNGCYMNSHFSKEFKNQLHSRFLLQQFIETKEGFKDLWEISEIVYNNKNYSYTFTPSRWNKDNKGSLIFINNHNGFFNRVGTFTII